MRIDRMLYPIEALGPGRRLSIWTAGCRKHCGRCANPELWESSKAQDIDITELFQALNDSIDFRMVDGITLTGGDPLEQKEEILKLLPLLKNVCKDILVYTGYTLEELEEHYDANEMKILKENISVLIDGRYIDALNTRDCVLRGSKNQRIIYFDQNYKPVYEKYLAQGRKIQNVYSDKGIISVGIHSKDK